VVEEPIMAGAIPIAEASPIFALAEPSAHETLKNESLMPPPEQTPLPTGIPSAAADAPSPPSTIDQLLPPGLAGKVPSGAKPKLIVLRGQRQNVEYQIYEGDNYIGRADDKAVDLDLEDQEPPDRIWSSRQHAVISFENGAMAIEDLNSTNGTYLNRTRIESGKKIPLACNDVIQIGTVQLKVVF
jgi:pSer/pThr/pTyr-binding forkhead associated (FHA) protein